MSSKAVKMDLNRPPVHESLRFTLPRQLRGRTIDEVSVRFLSDSFRALGGAEVSVQDFALIL